MAEADYTDEIWKTIPYAREYAVSTHGRVKRIVGGERRQAGRLIRTSLAGPRRSYVYVSFVHNDGIRRSKGVHVVMLETFVGLRPPGHEGAHCDGKSTNNVLSNLQWKTAKENSADRAKHGTQARGERSGPSKLTEEKVRAILVADGTQAQIGARFGVSQSAVWKIRSGKMWAHVR